MKLLNNSTVVKYPFILMIYTMLTLLNITASASHHENDMVGILRQYCVLYEFGGEKPQVSYEDGSYLFEKIKTKEKQLYQYLTDSQELYNKNRLLWESRCSLSLKLVELVLIKNSNQNREKVYQFLISTIKAAEEKYFEIENSIELLKEIDTYIQKNQDTDNTYTKLLAFFQKAFDPSQGISVYDQVDILKALNTPQKKDTMTIHEIPALKQNLNEGLFEPEQISLLKTAISNFEYLFIDGGSTGQEKIEFHMYQNIRQNHKDLNKYLLKLIISKKKLCYTLYARSKKKLYNKAIGLLMQNTYKGSHNLIKEKLSSAPSTYDLHIFLDNIIDNKQKTDRTDFYAGIYLEDLISNKNNIEKETLVARLKNTKNLYKHLDEYKGHYVDDLYYLAMSFAYTINHDHKQAENALARLRAYLEKDYREEVYQWLVNKIIAIKHIKNTDIKNARIYLQGCIDVFKGIDSAFPKEKDMYKRYYTYISSNKKQSIKHLWIDILQAYTVKDECTLALHHIPELNEHFKKSLFTSDSDKNIHLHIANYKFLLRGADVQVLTNNQYKNIGKNNWIKTALIKVIKLDKYISFHPYSQTYRELFRDSIAIYLAKEKHEKGEKGKLEKFIISFNTPALYGYITSHEDLLQKVEENSGKKVNNTKYKIIRGTMYHMPPEMHEEDLENFKENHQYTETKDNIPDEGDNDEPAAIPHNRDQVNHNTNINQQHSNESNIYRERQTSIHHKLSNMLASYNTVKTKRIVGSITGLVLFGTIVRMYMTNNREGGTSKPKTALSIPIDMDYSDRTQDKGSTGSTIQNHSNDTIHDMGNTAPSTTQGGIYLLIFILIVVVLFLGFFVRRSLF